MRVRREIVEKRWDYTESLIAKPNFLAQFVDSHGDSKTVFWMIAAPKKLEIAQVKNASLPRIATGRRGFTRRRFRE
jgi:hypothetical protein